MHREHFKLPELLAPAGNFEKLATAIHYGADAVYLAGKNFSLRARAGNFNNGELRDAVEYAHERGVKVYVTVNILAHNTDFDGLEEYLRFLLQVKADALIIADPGILSIAKSTVPDLPVHLSTQANVTNALSARFWAAQGVRRLNLARELGLDEIRDIRDATDIELEMFIHDLSTLIGETDDTAGTLNYTITRLCHDFVDRNGLSYTNVNTLIGMLECAKMELYRRVGSPYEDEKIEENGDVLPAKCIGINKHTDVFHFPKGCHK